MYIYRTKGTCSRAIEIELDGDILFRQAVYRVHNAVVCLAFAAELCIGIARCAVKRYVQALRGILFKELHLSSFMSVPFGFTCRSRPSLWHAR